MTEINRPSCTRSHQCPHRSCIVKSLIEKRKSEKKQLADQGKDVELQAGAVELTAVTLKEKL